MMGLKLNHVSKRGHLAIKNHNLNKLYNNLSARTFCLLIRKHLIKIRNFTIHMGNIVILTKFVWLATHGEIDILITHGKDLINWLHLNFIEEYNRNWCGHSSVAKNKRELSIFLYIAIPVPCPIALWTSSQHLNIAYSIREHALGRVDSNLNIDIWYPRQKYVIRVMSHHRSCISFRQ